MENKPLVSVIMNCYNSETYLKEAIESVLNQTYENFELIFWDNQSTDNSAEIVHTFDDKRIKYFYAPEHTSLGEGRNRALQKAQGEYISFLDCDDWWELNKIEKTLVCFSDSKIGLVHTNAKQFFQDKQEYKLLHHQMQPTGAVFEDMIANYNIALMSAMFRSEVLADLCEWFDTRFSMIEEFDFFVRIAKKWEIGYCDEVLCYWRAHQSSLTWKHKDKTLVELEAFKEKILQFDISLKDSYAIQKIEAKIAYYKFFNQWKKDGYANRKLILPYIFRDKRLIGIYLISFLGWDRYNRFLKFIGKSV